MRFAERKGKMISCTACAPESCAHLKCRGPTGQFAPSVFLMVAVGTTSPVVAAPAPVPVDVILANVGAIFDVAAYAFVAPRTGPYRFEYTIALQATGASDVQVLAQVGNPLSIVPIPQLSLSARLLAESDTLTGSAVIDMLQGQSFSLTASNVGGACTILGRPAATPPYLSLLCIYSLF